MSSGPMTTLRVILIGLLACDLVAIVALVVLMVRAIVGPEADDPHGYAVFASVFVLAILVPVGLLLLLALRWTRRPSKAPARDSRGGDTQP